MTYLKHLLLFLILFQSINAFAHGQPSIRVKAARIGYYDFYERFTGVGKCKYVTSRDYYAKVAGSVDSVLIKQGQAVSKNQIIITIDRELAISTLEEAKTAAESAESDYNRDLSLFRKKVISEEALNKSKVETRRSKLALATAEKRFADMVIQAPFDGYVGVVRAKEMDDVKVGDYLFSIVAEGEKVLFVELPENLLGKINPDAIIKASDSNNNLVEGKVIAVANYVSENGTVTLKSLFPDSAKLNHGGFTEITLFYNRHRGLAIPEKAVLKNDKGNFVYKISEDKTVKQIYVHLGTRTGDWLELTGNDLKEGDLIVTEGLTKIANDSPVELINE